MPSTAHIQDILGRKGIQAALDAACEQIRNDRLRLDELWASPFFERRVLDSGVKKLWPVTRRQISNAYDLQDDGEPIPDYFWCDEHGELHRITLGEQSNVGGNEDSFIYATSDLYAAGRVVGWVEWTDH